MIHISQVINYDDELEADGDRGTIYIKVRKHKNGKYWIAESAHEYWVDDDGDGEDDAPVDLLEALKSLTRYIPMNCYQPSHGMYSVLKANESEEDMLPLIFKTKDAEGKDAWGTLELKK